MLWKQLAVFPDWYCNEQMVIDGIETGKLLDSWPMPALAVMHTGCLYQVE